LFSQDTNHYLRRRDKEQELLTQAEPIRKTGYISSNTKTGHSLNFPILNCTPTKICASSCYACLGPTSWKASLLKALAIENTLQSNMGYALTETVGEIKKLSLTELRYSGGGDLSDHGVNYIIELAALCPDVIFWGFTRKIRVAEKLASSGKSNIKVIYSLDAKTSLAAILKIKELGIKTSWLYNDQANIIPKDIHIVFVNHVHGSPDPSLKEVNNECPAIRKHQVTCFNCKKCFNF